jgi:hypothetical protein
MENLFALDGEQAREDTLCEAGAQDDDLLGIDTGYRRGGETLHRILHPWWFEFRISLSSLDGNRHT